MSHDIPLSDEDVFEKLSPVEQVWSDRQALFESYGYTLRPRFRAGQWVPSWRRDPSIQLFSAEDHLSSHMLRFNVMDATRISDGKLVLLKRVKTSSPEIDIASFLSSKELRNDPRNRCVPVLDVIVDKDPSLSYIVMPFLRYIDDPDFDTVGSILECADQFLEGLAFMHEHNVAHRDCAYKNVMMDGTSLFPQGFHPMLENFLPDDIDTLAPYLPRATTPVPYYFIDFGLSSMFSPDDTSRLVTGVYGLDKEVPELSATIPYDPFKADIFILGNMFRKTFIQRYSNVDFLWPLVIKMTSRDPSERPSAAQALDEFRVLRQDIWAVHSMWRARKRDEPLIVTALFDIASLCSTAYRGFF